ncbi:hypothetical protein L6452_03399 [Arctium lappa]|uniref:Uncharacterized protein n=1 Tax=Arctium lappa TaxID=4217 RepID=A0ACB9FN43_ARCLA|nr:hypothetical protein L6452_03399 [Arctium lappa]
MEKKQCSLLDSISILSNVPEISVESNEVSHFLSHRERGIQPFYAFLSADRPSPTTNNLRRKIRSRSDLISPNPPPVITPSVCLIDCISPFLLQILIS